MTYSAEVLADNPEVYWRLNESSGTVAADSSGNGNAGQIDNAPTFSDPGLLVGDADTAILFASGTNQSIMSNNGGSLISSGTLSEWTIEVMLRIDADVNAEIASLAGNTDYFGLHTPGDGTLRGYGTVQPVSVALDLGVAHHYAFVYDGTNNLLYVDGVLADSVADIDFVLTAEQHHFWVANTALAGGLPPDGVIDEAAFYLTALSPTRVLAHSDAAFGIEPPPDPPVFSGGLSGASAAGLGILNDVECNGTLTINGVLMHNQAWAMLDLGDLWFPPKTRGSNVVIPGAVGRRAYPVRADETTYSLPMLISGVVAPGGVMYSDAMVGLETNIGLLADVFVPDPNVATVTASLEMPSGAVRTAEVQIVGVKLGKQVGPVVRAVLEMVVPAGGFA